MGMSLTSYVAYGIAPRGFDCDDSFCRALMGEREEYDFDRFVLQKYAESLGFDLDALEPEAPNWNVIPRDRQQEVYRQWKQTDQYKAWDEARDQAVAALPLVELINTAYCYEGPPLLAYKSMLIRSHYGDFASVVYWDDDQKAKAKEQLLRYASVIGLDKVKGYKDDWYGVFLTGHYG